MAKYRIAQILLCPNERKRLELMADLVKESELFKNIIAERMRSGCSYRFEMTFAAQVIDEATCERIADLVNKIGLYIRAEAVNRVRLVKVEVYPKCLSTIHKNMWKFIHSNLTEFVASGPAKLLQYEKRELLCIMERLMIVNINGNLSRNLSGWSSRHLNLSKSIERYNWPFMNTKNIQWNDKRIRIR